jgi:hypothetical protein
MFQHCPHGIIFPVVAAPYNIHIDRLHILTQPNSLVDQPKYKYMYMTESNPTLGKLGCDNVKENQLFLGQYKHASLLYTRCIVYAYPLYKYQANRAIYLLNCNHKCNKCWKRKYIHCIYSLMVLPC